MNRPGPWLIQVGLEFRLCEFRPLEKLELPDRNRFRHIREKHFIEASAGHKIDRDLIVGGEHPVAARLKRNEPPYLKSRKKVKQQQRRDS